METFHQFIKRWKDILISLAQDDKGFKIFDATNTYVSQIVGENSFDITKVIETMLTVLKVDGVSVFPYPGTLDLDYETTSQEILAYKVYGKKTKVSTIFKPTKNRYNIGIFSVYKNGQHYLTFILDNVEKRAWLFDSLSTVAGEHFGFSKLISTFYPKYKITGVSVCSGCKVFEPLAADLPRGEYINQNIFCHTWSMWFIYQVTMGIKNQRSIASTVESINNSCGTPRENLIKIKQFAFWLSENVLEVSLPKDFQYIFNPQHVIESGSAFDVYEMINSINELPPLV